eukprot:12943872-Alexandrium_andersonii.AAC.1
MSASLVGSEMCIRDRLARARELRKARSGARSPPRWPSGGFEVDRCRLSPVSYTHLTLPTICSV